MNYTLLQAKMEHYRKLYGAHIFDHSEEFLLKHAARTIDCGNKAVNNIPPFTNPEYWYKQAEDFLAIAILKEEWDKRS